MSYKPDSVVFYVRPEGEYEAYGQKTKCAPAFPVPIRLVTSNSKTSKNAKAWSKGAFAFHSYMSPDDIQDVVGVDSPNVPRTGYKLVGAEQRGEGGRAWKVVTPDGYLVDMREDVVMTILIRDGIPADGVLKGEFVWGAQGSNLRLIEVGTDQWKEYQRDWEK